MGQEMAAIEKGSWLYSQIQDGVGAGRVAYATPQCRGGYVHNGKHWGG